MTRFSFRIAGQSGSGLSTIGDILLTVFQRLGFFIVSEREYPSLIKGGDASYLINISEQKIYSIKKEADILLALDKPGLLASFPFLKDRGILLFGYDRVHGLKKIFEEAIERNIQHFGIESRTLATTACGMPLMHNIATLGFFCASLGLPEKVFLEVLSERFSQKEFFLPSKKAFLAGKEKGTLVFSIPLPSSKKIYELFDSNQMIALGAVSAGMKFFAGYPMTPATTIMTSLQRIEKKADILVKQAEDEITAAQMVLGASFAGTRAMTATSGGGFDLMTETVSLASIAEIPFVCVLAQRVGPATGMPTWTGQEDLETAIHAGHSECPKAVLSVSDPVNAYEMIQKAFDIADKYQMPVIVLTEKYSSESKITTDSSELKALPIDRHLVSEKEFSKLKSTDRYLITPSGVSPRWLVGSGGPFYFTNSDEHLENGAGTESADTRTLMHKKRLRKLDSLLQELPPPRIFGEEKNADISFISFGSTLGVLLDAQAELAKQKKKLNILHFDFLWPLKTENVKNFLKENKNVFVIEANATGQLANLLEMHLKAKLPNRFLKFDGRRFDIEGVLSFIHSHLS